MDKVFERIRNGIDDVDEDDVEHLQERIEELIPESFQGIEDYDDSTNDDELTFMYQYIPEYVLERLLANGFDVPAFITLHSFLDNAITELFIQTLPHSEKLSNRERNSLEHISIKSKSALLKGRGVIPEDVHEDFLEFNSTRNKLTHQADEHLFSEQKGRNIRNAFESGYRAYNYLKIRNIHQTVTELEDIQDLMEEVEEKD